MYFFSVKIAGTTVKKQKLNLTVVNITFTCIKRIKIKLTPNI